MTQVSVTSRLLSRLWTVERAMLLAAAVLLMVGAMGPLAPRAAAQIGETTDILTGRVLGPDGKPMADVTVAATSAESGITRTKRTGDDGRYTILFPDGGGQYRVEFRAIGFAPVSRNVARQGDEDRLVTDITVGSQVPTKLSSVQVTARRRNPAQRGQPPTPGEQGQTLGADQLARLPIDQSDLSAVAALAPGVVPVPGTDSTDAAFSVAGQRSSLNNTTLDGLSFGSFTVPQEGLRSTRVVTNTYDPARGQFSGGEIQSTTRAGTNDLTGGFTYSRRDPVLEFEGTDSAAISPVYLQDQISGGLGGPIIKDKLFVFASGQFRRRSDPFQSLLAASPASLQSLGLQPDSVALFEGQVNQLGLPSAALTPDRRIGDNSTGLVRMDYFLTDAHTLTLRGDWRRSTQDPTRSSPYALPTSTGTSVNTGSGLAATLTSYFESGIINQLQGYYTRSHNEAAGYLTLPSGRVRVTSALADGTQGVSVLTFGGNSAFPQTGTTTLLELNDEVSYLTHDRQHRIRLGTLLDLNDFRQDVTSNRLGTFTYNTLDAFTSNTPDSYTRSLLQQQRLGSTTAGAIYLGDTWRPNDKLQLVYGLRGEATRVGDAPALNQEVEQLFGFRTNNFPAEVHVSPRMGFSLNLTKADPNDPFARFLPAFLVRGGIGEFRAKTPSGLYTSAASATGLTNTEQQLTCIGDAVPTPDWASYIADPYSTPTSCVTGASTPPSYATTARSVTVFDPDFEAPRSWRASLGVQHQLVGTISVSADASYARGVALYGVRDLNLSPTPAFTLANEGGRPVYAPAGAIVPTSGQVSSAASRRYSQFGQVLELTSGLASDTRQLTLGLNGTSSRGTTYHLSYTLQRTRDQSSFNCCSAAQGFASPTTAGNPNVTEWSPGDMDIRHSIQGYVTYPIRPWFEITANGRLSSGAPFTPMVGGDVNGDGARNDRAFIFDPANTSDPRVAAAMQTLLQTAPSRVRDCLTQQLGTVAARNSCRGPWTPSLDMQANFIPQGFGMKGKATFSLIAANVLAGLDELLHGSNLRGWGQYNRADPTLLYVRGFDPTTQSYIYDVNGRFGSNNVSRSVYRQPFVVALQARVNIGPDPRDRFRRIFAQRSDTAAARAAAVQNPIARIIGMKDTLQLNDDQVAKLTVVSDTLAAKTTAIATEIRTEVQKKGTSDPRAVMSIIRPYITQGRQALQAAMTAAQGILTPDQWAKVPDDVKNPRGMGGFGGPGGGRNGGRGRGPDR